jgi:hypothetical protein
MLKTDVTKGAIFVLSNSVLLVLFHIDLSEVRPRRPYHGIVVALSPARTELLPR